MTEGTALYKNKEMNMDISKKDWSLFREKLPDWQEGYIGKLNSEYVKLLNGEGNASDKFWALEERIKKIKPAPGSC